MTLLRGLPVACLHQCSVYSGTGSKQSCKGDVQHHGTSQALSTAAMPQVLTIIVMGSQVSRLRGELHKADAMNGHQKDDNVRLQVSSRAYL